MGCSAWKYDALEWVHRLSVWYGFVVNSSGLGIPGGSLLVLTISGGLFSVLGSHPRVVTSLVLFPSSLLGCCARVLSSGFLVQLLVPRLWAVCVSLGYPLICLVPLPWLWVVLWLPLLGLWAWLSLG